MDAQLLEFTLARIKYKDWKLIVGDMGEGFFIQACFIDQDHDTGKPSEIKGRKWYVSKHAIVDEVIKTAWLAVEMAERHEMLETFLVDGKAPFHPHNEFTGMLNLPKCQRQEIVPKALVEDVDPTEREMLTAKQAAEAMNIDVNSVYRLLNKGELARTSILGAVRVSRAEVNRFLDRQTAKEPFK